MNLTDDEIRKLKMLVCDHDITVDSIHCLCSCCGRPDKICFNCDKFLEHECDDHDTEDGYCGSCR
jgi:hypothetical protein